MEQIIALDMGAQCAFCAGKSFRRSHLQTKDLRTLLLLRYPVRCLSCSQRQTVLLPVACRAAYISLQQGRTPKTRPRNASEAVEEIIPATPAPQKISAVEAKATSPLPMRPTMVMPNLKGVTLQHRTSIPMESGPK